MTDSVGTMQCRTCAEQFTPSPHQLRSRHFQCRACIRSYWRAWRAARKASGHQLRDPVKASEYYREYARRYFEKPENLAKRKESQRRHKLTEGYALKAAARSLVQSALRNGSMKRQPCARCGKEDAQAHHEDYSKPLDVVWLCAFHHGARHAEIRREQQAGNVAYEARECLPALAQGESK